MAHKICEDTWLKRLLELKIPTENSMKMLRDNQATTSISKNPVHHDRIKHVEIDCHFIKEKIEKGIINIVYTPICLRIADILTKVLPRDSL